MSIAAKALCHDTDLQPDLRDSVLLDAYDDLVDSFEALIHIGRLYRMASSVVMKTGKERFQDIFALHGQLNVVPMEKLQGHEDIVYSVKFSPDRRYVASSSMDNTVRVWDANAGAVLTTLQGHEDTALCCFLAGRYTHCFGIAR